MSPQENEGQSNLICILLCAGEGTRIRGHIGNIPKSLMSISILQNKPILNYTINQLLKFDIKRIVIITGYLKEKIEESIIKLTNQSPKLIYKIILFDSKSEYQKGPLYSFLSIAHDNQICKDDLIYSLFPGDTVFDDNLLNEIFNQQKILIDNPKVNCMFFFREIKLRSLKERYRAPKNDFKVFISIVKIKMRNKKKYLKKIIQKDMSKLSTKKAILQIIPCFSFNLKFIQELKLISSKKKLETLTEATNLLVKTGFKIMLHQVTSDMNFYDIDTYEDLEFYKKKVDNSSSDNLRIHGSKI